MSKRALCVGINKFKNYSDATLHGCVNDANEMSDLLQGSVGLGASEVKILTDADATKDHIISELSDMVAGAKAGKYKYLAFSLSSHGTQVPDLSGDEADRADEAFCPHDLAQKGDVWDPNHVIVDDELSSLFSDIPKDVLLEVFLDTCHSGTGLKAIDMLLDRRVRYLPPPSIAAFRDLAGRRQRGVNRALLEKGMLHHVLWAACRADQTSADAKIGTTWHGAFTYFFAQRVRKDKAQPRKTTLTLVRHDLREGHYGQMPQLEGESKNKAVGVGAAG